MKKSEVCGLCGGKTKVQQTDRVQVFDESESFQGVPIVWHKFQRRRCEVCGAEGRTPIFIGRTEWEISAIDRH